MSEINFGKTVSLAQAAKLILATPMNRYMLRGEPGIGKSSLLKTLSASLPNHETAYIDVPNMDLGDIAMPVINHENKTTAYYPNARFKVHTGKPIITMLDEFTKGAEPIKNMLHPLLEVANPRLGDISVHPESIVFLTGNLASDGVGDTLKAHTLNRIIPLNVRKPDADEWITWAINNGIEAEVIAWVRQFPQAMASYTDPAQSENPYIFNPKRAQTAFVSPRSLVTASNIVRTRHKNDNDSVIAALIGSIGESGARDMQAYLEFSDQVPTWEQTITHPTTTKIPTDPGACAIVVFGAISRVEKGTITPFMQYMERMSAEWQAVFAINVSRAKTKQQIAFSCKAFADWVAKNQDLL
jgi:hypothetical protein